MPHQTQGHRWAALLGMLAVKRKPAVGTSSLGWVLVRTVRPPPQHPEAVKTCMATGSVSSVSGLAPLFLGFGVPYFNNFLGTCHLKGTITK